MALNPQNYISILTHFVWGIQESSPILENEAMRQLLLGTIKQIAEKNGFIFLCSVACTDHIHLIVDIGKNQKPARIVHTLQDMSTEHFKKEFGLPIPWHEAFLSVSIARKELPTITEYLTDHHRHHIHKSYQQEYFEIIHDFIMIATRQYTIEVSGHLACFTRPEMKVERVSYEVITPSAVRAIFESIYWKPHIRWRVLQIDVLKPIAFTHIRRCEVASIASTKKDYIIAENHRQLRSSLVLRDVAYRLTAYMEVLSGSTNLETENISEKHSAIFERRASRGQCFTQPYLGCREFSADWRLVSNDEPCTPITESRDLGIMLYDMDFSNPENPQPKFFRAVMNNGIINLPRL